VFRCYYFGNTIASYFEEHLKNMEVLHIVKTCNDITSIVAYKYVLNRQRTYTNFQSKTSQNITVTNLSAYDNYKNTHIWKIRRSLTNV